MKKIVFFTGAGMSAESGLSTFRSGDGLWENYSIEDVCTPEALARNRNLVVDFYNMRRRDMLAASPNAGHLAIASLAKHADVEVITQNVDNLHERAALQLGVDLKVMHLHGELTKLCSSFNKERTVGIEGWEQDKTLTHADGSLLRPYIVFFGEDVPLMQSAISKLKGADVFVVVGTSLAVYPAASLLHFVPNETKIYLIDPTKPELGAMRHKVSFMQSTATQGVPKLINELKLLG